MPVLLTLASRANGAVAGADGGAPSPNIFHIMGLKGLDESGDPKKMATGGGSTKSQPAQIDADSSAVKVALVIRPMLPGEVEKGATNVLKVILKQDMPCP
jgi:hypothetical protein